MSVLFLTSDIGASKKENGVRVVTKLNNTNKFIENLQKFVKGGNLVIIASNPNSHKVNDEYAKLTFNSFNMSGFDFKKLWVVDERTKEIDVLLKKANLIFLAGGDTAGEMRYYTEIGLGEKLKSLNTVILGQSAGALNMAEEVYCSPEDESELNNERYFDGLGLTHLNIEPHYKNSPHFKKWGDLQKILLQDSKKKHFIAITDGSYIIEEETYFEIFGEAYSFDNGKCSQICQNGLSLRLKKLPSVDKYVL